MKKNFNKISSLIDEIVLNGAKKRGFSISLILMKWKEVVGEYFYDITIPLKITFNRNSGEGTLHIGINEAHAPEINLQKEILIEKVNIEKLRNAGIKSDVYFSNIDLNLMYSLIKEEFFEVKPVSKYPTVVRDFSFLIDNNVLFEDIKYTILSISPELITSVALTDSYIPEKTSSKTSYSFTVSISSVKKTMSDKEIKYISQKIIKSVSKEHNAVLRD